MASVLTLPLSLSIILISLSVTLHGSYCQGVRFLSQPSSTTCQVGKTALFFCQPSGDVNTTVTWTVNDRPPDAFDSPIRSSFMAGKDSGKYWLNITGCRDEWDGYCVKCIIKTPDGKLFSDPTFLGVTKHPIEFLVRHRGAIISFVIGAVGVGLILCLCCLLIYCCCCATGKKYQRRSRKDDGGPTLQDTFRESSVKSLDKSLDVRNKERTDQEIGERAVAEEAVKQNLPKEYEFIKCLPDIGRRLQKHWFKVHHCEERRDMILTRSAISKKCNLILDEYDSRSHVSKLNKMLTRLQHLSLQQVYAIHPDPSDSGFVFVIQPLVERGSLRDIIHGTTSLQESSSLVDIDWKEKYNGTGKLLPVETISLYGRQILESMESLYEQGFPPLGHVHTGNIFVEGDVCRLGGYENTLLGYRTSLYRVIEENDCLESIDIIMFGHVIYEMSAGKALPVTALVPSEDDLKCVEDEKREILEHIFTRKKNGQFAHTIQKILKHKFFKEDVGEMRSFLSMVSGESGGESTGAGILRAAGSIFKPIKGAFSGTRSGKYPVSRGGDDKELSSVLVTEEEIN